MTAAVRLRCAIYTRKSSEDGLQQGFNSLDAQHEACAAYVASQRHEGWRLVAGRYEDGGVSGGTLERPALQRLLADIDAGRVDMVVVYKIDRLTRSLTDFAQLVDRLDRAGCAFVSVTQAFNTSSSMGRLTLNVLLSFAQFEREVTAERIRDKIAASKKKGMWMGGLPPLGYDPDPDPHTRGLVVNAAEAGNVRALFGLYDRHGCLRTVAEEAHEHGIRSKRRQFADGRRVGGRVMSRGQIHFLLTNPIYRGLIRHRDQTWPGQHEAIIDEALWDRVQQKLQAASNRARRTCEDARPRLTTTAPLAGRLFDETGDRLTPSHAMRRGKRYRYYVSHRLVRGDAGADLGGWRLPALALEHAIAETVASRIRCLAARQAIAMAPDVHRHAGLAETAAGLADNLSRNEGEWLGRLVVVARLAPGTIRISLDRDSLGQALGLPGADLDGGLLAFDAPFALRRRGAEKRIVAGERLPIPDPTLQKALVRAHGWLTAIRHGIPLLELARREKVSPSFVRHRLPLAFLSPGIQATIIEGRQPVDLTLERLVRHGIPLDWSEQAGAFGMMNDGA
ncbi:MAG: recombinase family protein [Pseudomonadota bacterium]